MAQQFLNRRGRVAARLATGWLAHLYGGLADSGVLLARYVWARARRRSLS